MITSTEGRTGSRTAGLDRKTFGDVLRKMREDAGIERRTFANRSQLKNAAKIEAGEAVPNFLTVLIWLEACGRTLHDLADRIQPLDVDDATIRIRSEYKAIYEALAVLLETGDAGRLEAGLIVLEDLAAGATGARQRRRELRSRRSN